MRNLAQYPVTKNELLGYFKKLFDDIDIYDIAPGDMYPLYIREITKIVEGSEYKYDLLKPNA